MWTHTAYEIQNRLCLWAYTAYELGERGCLWIYTPSIFRKRTISLTLFCGTSLNLTRLALRNHCGYLYETRLALRNCCAYLYGARLALHNRCAYLYETHEADLRRLTHLYASKEAIRRGAHHQNAPRVWHRPTKKPRTESINPWLCFSVPRPGVEPGWK